MICDRKPAGSLQGPIILRSGITLTSRLRRSSHSPFPRPQKVFAMSPATTHGCSETVTSFDSLTNITPTREQTVALKKVHDRLRLLRLVLERVPNQFTPHKAEPAYKLTYYTEKLECGHTTLYFPQCGPPTKRRHCPTCALRASLPEKKPSQSATESEVITHVSRVG